jgi:polyphenol oxidase
MAFYSNGSIRYFTFDLLDGYPITQATVTRRGGVSPHPWAALNVGGTVGDDAGRVSENRQRMFEALDLELTGAYDVWQVHSAEVVCTDRPRMPGETHLQADAILTDQPGVTLFMRFADCVPIFLYDPVRLVVGLAHAGWKGTIQNIPGRVVQTMEARYGCVPQDLLAGIGPSIGPDHYEVGEDVVAQVQRAFGADAASLIVTGNGTQATHLDLWKANRLSLEQAGVEQIEIAGICTACNTEDWYSHRAEHGRTGRFGAVIQAMP